MTILQIFIAQVVVLTTALSAIDTSGFRHAAGSPFPAEDSSRGVLVVHFCGHCPKAKSWMAETIQPITEAVQRHQAPLDVICVTPDIGDKALASFARGVNITHASIAQDTVNKRKISTKNIYQVSYTPGVGGTAKSYNWQNIGDIIKQISDKERHQELGSFTYPAEQYNHPKIKKLWWGIEYNQDGAIPALVKAHKRAKAGDDLGDQLISLYNAVSLKRMEVFNQAIAMDSQDLAHYEALEQGIYLADGFAERDAMRTAKSTLSKLKRDKTISKELKIRTGYQNLIKMTNAPHLQDIAKGWDGMRQLASKYADTVYGQKAAELIADRDAKIQEENDKQAKKAAKKAAKQAAKNQQ